MRQNDSDRLTAYRGISAGQASSISLAASRLNMTAGKFVAAAVKHYLEFLVSNGRYPEILARPLLRDFQDCPTVPPRRTAKSALEEARIKRTLDAAIACGLIPPERASLYEPVKVGEGK